MIFIEQNVLNKRNLILKNVSNASLEEISQILDHYKSSQIIDSGTVSIQPVLVNGTIYHFKYNPQEAASLNARYRELTGKDHPVFLEEQTKVLNLLLSNKEELVKQGYLSMQIDTLERLRTNLTQETPVIEIANENHIINRTTDILMNLNEASLNDISSLLNYYDGEAIVINGIAHCPFNDPISAAKLNTRYRELIGRNHPVFIERAPRAIDDLIKNKDMLLQAGAYSPEYFETLEKIKNGFDGELEVQPKYI